MAKKISQLTQATEVKSDDVTVIVQDGETKKLPLNMMVTKQDIENKKVAGLAKLDEIEATYENDTYTPTITVENKSSVKTGEGDEVDYSANVMDGHVKSAILSGQTLVNLLSDDKFEGSATIRGWDFALSYPLTTNKTYLLIVNVTKDDTDYGWNCRFTNGTNYPIYQTDIKGTGIKKIKFTPSVELTKFSPYFQLEDWNNGKYVTLENMMVLEYQDGMENWDIPYFTGMQSVKLPVLTTSNEDGAKTNILTVSEDVTLRGVGDVQDTLDLLTGEVTERIGEIVLDGSENWSRQGVSQNNSDLGIYYSTTALPNTIFNTNNVLCDKFKTSKTLAWHSSEEDIYVSISTYGLKICFDERKLESTTVEGFKKWLSENTPTIQYPLVEKPIKTVDLIPSGTHPSTTPYCWKDGHIQLSSSGLLPNLEYSVVTSRAGQINQNATMIVKNDKRIFDLEILLAGGLVNTTYQALTLQNQVETGLSKVSLNSETEPDYLLYHMIMKLIEEKAYKLDDLTEKVSVFYLYEKLSDEQFETIYSALYPFVEDEIVEEPVVEELPEVVEDEVIM